MIGRLVGVMTAPDPMLIEVPGGRVDGGNQQIRGVDLDGGGAPELFPDRGVVGVRHEAPGEVADVSHGVLTASKTASALFARSLNMWTISMEITHGGKSKKGGRKDGRGKRGMRSEPTRSR
jgi:hypothetical protein